MQAAVLPAKAAVAAAPAGMFPLVVAGQGHCVAVCAVKGGHETKRFLTELGFVEGALVSIVCESGGNMIAEVKGARIALSRQMASRIMVCER